MDQNKTLEILNCSALGAKILSLYNSGMPPGDSTQWPTMDPYYTVKPGQWTLVTGVPSHGKSTWVDCLTVNLASIGWRFVMFSPEQEPMEAHMSLLAEKVQKKPFRKGFNGCMGKPELAAAIKFIDTHYKFLRSPEQSLSIPSLLDVMEHASIAIHDWRHEGIEGPFGVVVDPWNELNHDLQGEYSETKYICEMLSMLRRWARNIDCHIWLVAHPKMMLKNPKTGLYPVPKPYDISGCYSDDTEVLTKRGWLKHSDLSLNDEIACFDTLTSTTIFDKPERIICKPYSGPMHNFSGYGFDLCVTPEHRMVVMPEWKQKKSWTFYNAENLPSAQFSLPLTAPLVTNVTDSIGCDMAALLGWYVAEGTIQGSGVAISQHIPKEIFNGSHHEKLSFLTSYLNGDGTKRTHGGFSATTTSPLLRDDLQRLCLELGLNCSWKKRIPSNKNHSISWQINIGFRKKTSLRKQRNHSFSEYSGNVWCLTVATGAYVVRRNGKMCICGNSAHWYNKADNCITVWRPEEGITVEIHIQKIRFRHIGKRGVIPLNFDCGTGTYSDIKPANQIFCGSTHITHSSTDDF